VKALATALILALVSPSPADAELQQAIALVKEGDFDRAVPRLDAAIKRLETKGGPKGDLSQAHLYLGIAYLELDQEASARARFREALGHDPKLRLDPRSFSPQTLRVFEAARAELPPAKKKGVPVLLIAGGAAAAAGIAVAAAGDGGGSGNPTTTVSSPTTTTPATITTTTTTTLPAAQCGYDLSPFRTTFSKNGGNGICNVETSAGCGWTSEVNATWIQIQSGRSGVGPGSIRYRVLANDDRARKARIELRQAGGGVRCEIEQAADSFRVTDLPAELSFVSDLQIEAGRGRVSLNGVLQAQGHGRAEGRAPARRAANLIEATLIEGRGRGTWRLEIPGARPGSLRPVAGEVAQLGPDSVSFRLAGVPGERVAVAFVVADSPR